MPRTPHDPSKWLAPIAAAAALLPALIAWNLPPSSTFFNQATAFGLWGGFVALLAWCAPAGWATLAAGRAVWPLLAVLAGIATFALAGGVAGPLPASLVWPPLAAIAAAAAMLLVAVGAGRGAVRAFLWAFVLAGVASAAIAFVQVFAPAWADGTWVARSTLPGRAVGNLRQPNHLATLLLWGAIALVPLADASSRRARVAAGAAWLLLLAALELTGSRTGALGVALLVVWGFADRRLGRFARALLLGAPLVYALAWASSWLGGLAVGAATRAAEADLSSSRFAIWSDTLTLIAQQPWTGVGFARFNFAWTLTPLPSRPVAFFDHTHNLPLQFAVEFGLPLGLAMFALVLFALWRAGRGAWGADASRRALFVMLLLVGVHSLLEYPLWYVHFLLPTVWAWGACLGGGDTAPGAPRRGRSPLVWCGLAMLLGALVAIGDYLRIARIFAPPPNAAPLAQRIAEGQGSPLFGHHADYAAATVAAEPAQAMDAFGRAAFHLLDTRLLQAWARAWADAGDLDRARHIAARLREFRRPESRAFFAPCEPGAAAAGTGVPAAAPFQCAPPGAALGWRDFVR